jgi:acyl-CoA thioester hydrolase
MSTLPANRSVIETTLRVRYAETDAMGVVYHTNYIIWFEVGRGEYSRQMGADYRTWEQAGYLLPVTEVACRYLAPARYGDLVTVYTWVEETRSRMVTFAYEVRMQETGKTLASGRTVHVCVNRNGQPAQIPAAWRAAMERPPSPLV